MRILLGNRNIVVVRPLEEAKPSISRAKPPVIPVADEISPI